MLIGNNFNNNQNEAQNKFTKPLGNHFENNQFVNKNEQFQQTMNQNPTQHKNIFTKDFKTQQHINPTNKQDMADKSLAIVHERLQQGSISLDEFNRKCEELGKKRQN